VATPLNNRQEQDSEDNLLEQGPKKTNVPEFVLFAFSMRTYVCLFQKRLEEDEKLAIGKRGIVIF
jgi:hypothetical protein